MAKSYEGFISEDLRNLDMNVVKPSEIEKLRKNPNVIEIKDHGIENVDIYEIHLFSGEYHSFEVFFEALIGQNIRKTSIILYCEVKDKDIHSTNSFDCPTTGFRVEGEFYSTTNELKFKPNRLRDPSDSHSWLSEDHETAQWCYSHSAKNVKDIEAANGHIVSIGLDNSLICFK